MGAIFRGKRCGLYTGKYGTLNLVVFHCHCHLVVQLVKSRDNNKKLRLKIESKPSKDLEFDDGKVCENRGQYYLFYVTVTYYIIIQGFWNYAYFFSFSANYALFIGELCTMLYNMLNSLSLQTFFGFTFDT